MRRNWVGRPHRLALLAAAATALIGIALLMSPWDGAIVVLAWVLIVAAVVVAVLTLFFVRTPSS